MKDMKKLKSYFPLNPLSPCLLYTYQKKLACADQTYQLSQLQSAYDSISAGNDGKGNISVYAKNDGKVSKAVSYTHLISSM